MNTNTEGDMFQLIKLIRNPTLLNFDIFKDKRTTKYFSVGMCLLLASTILGVMSYFLFYIMLFFSSLKCMLWLFEQYVPDINSKNDKNVFTQDISNQLDQYKSENTSDDVLEYCIIPIFIVLVVYPLAYIPIPMLSVVTHGTSVLLAITAMTNKSYRKKLCLFLRDLFTSSNCRDSRGKYVPGNEGEFHKLLQMLCCMIESTSLNISHKLRSIYTKNQHSKEIQTDSKIGHNNDNNDNSE